MSALVSRRLTAEYAEWADERGLAEDGHDAAYAGMLSGVRVRIDTGVRDSGVYAVVVSIAVACGLAPTLLKRGVDGVAEEVDDDRVVVAARALLAETAALRSVRFEEDAVELRFDAGAATEDVERAVAAIADAWRSPGGVQAPFR